MQLPSESWHCSPLDKEPFMWRSDTRNTQTWLLIVFQFLWDLRIDSNQTVTFWGVGLIKGFFWSYNVIDGYREYMIVTQGWNIFGEICFEELLANNLQSLMALTFDPEQQLSPLETHFQHFPNLAKGYWMTWSNISTSWWPTLQRLSITSNQ